VWDQSAVILVGAFESIATTTVGAGGSGTITFSSIPSTYKHLQLRTLTRSPGGNVNFRYNSDSASNYWTHWLDGDGATIRGESSGTSTLTYAGFGATATASANVFGSNVIDILDYANTTKYKVSRALSGYDQNGSGWVGLISGVWNSTAAISTITITTNSSTFPEYSQFALYGIKG
jgi:hypothetical protein